MRREILFLWLHPFLKCGFALFSVDLHQPRFLVNNFFIIIHRNNTGKRRQLFPSASRSHPFCVRFSQKRARVSFSQRARRRSISLSLPPTALWARSQFLYLHSTPASEIFGRKCYMYLHTTTLNTQTRVVFKTKANRVWWKKLLTRLRSDFHKCKDA